MASSTKALRLEWRGTSARIAECDILVCELSDGWHVLIDLNVVRTARTTIEHGPLDSEHAAKQWAEERLARHARIERNRMRRILRSLGDDHEHDI